MSWRQYFTPDEYDALMHRALDGQEIGDPRTGHLIAAQCVKTEAGRAFLAEVLYRGAAQEGRRWFKKQMTVWMSVGERRLRKPKVGAVVVKDPVTGRLRFIVKVFDDMPPDGWFAFRRRLRRMERSYADALVATKPLDDCVRRHPEASTVKDAAALDGSSIEELLGDAAA